MLLDSYLIPPFSHCLSTSIMALSARCTSAQQTGGPRVGRCVAIARPKLPVRSAVVSSATTDSNADKKQVKILKREEEPEEYWVSKAERKGANPMSDPLAIIGLAAIFLPFVLLGIAVATGLVDLSVYR